jgi:hypothetical protein
LRKSFKLPEKLKKETEREFPSDFALQQIHFARAILREETRGMSKEEVINYYRRKASELARQKVPS